MEALGQALQRARVSQDVSHLFLDGKQPGHCHQVSPRRRCCPGKASLSQRAQLRTEVKGRPSCYPHEAQVISSPLGGCAIIAASETFQKSNWTAAASLGYFFLPVFGTLRKYVPLPQSLTKFLEICTLLRGVKVLSSNFISRQFREMTLCSAPHTHPSYSDKRCCPKLPGFCLFGNMARANSNGNTAT